MWGFEVGWGRIDHVSEEIESQGLSRILKPACEGQSWGGLYITSAMEGGGFSVHANANYCFFQQWQQVFAKDLGRGDNKSKWSNSVWQRGDLKTNYWLSMMTIKRWSNVGMKMQKRMIRSPWVSRRVIPRLENIERFGRLGGGFMLNTNCQVSRWHLSSNIDRSTVCGKVKRRTNL